MCINTSAQFKKVNTCWDSLDVCPLSSCPAEMSSCLKNPTTVLLNWSSPQFNAPFWIQHQTALNYNPKSMWFMLSLWHYVPHATPPESCTHPTVLPNLALYALWFPQTVKIPIPCYFTLRNIFLIDHWFSDKPDTKFKPACLESLSLWSNFLPFDQF